MVPDIRELAVEQLARWITRLPDMFFNDSHLKYLGWSLSDKAETVRRAAVQGLTRVSHPFKVYSPIRTQWAIVLQVYALEQAEEEAAHFSGRFKVRMIQCCEDVSESVQASALELITALHVVGHLDAVDSDRAIELMFSSEASVARAAAQLFVKVQTSSHDFCAQQDD